MLFRKALKKPVVVENLCHRAHELVGQLTSDLQPPEDSNSEIIRKKVSMYIFGIVSAFATHEEMEPSPVYQSYLQYVGGLNATQSYSAVDRAQRLIDKYPDARHIYSRGIDAGKQWISERKFDRDLFLDIIGLA